MKIREFLIRASAGAAMLASTAGAFGQKSWNAPYIVTSYCAGCHGIDGNAQLPYIPKLGGLDVAYAERKLMAFKEVAPPSDELFSALRRLSGVKKDAGNVSHEERVNMEGVAHAAKPEAIKEAVQWYARQPPAPGHGGNKRLIAEGKQLFMNGVPAQKVLPCTSCHGPDALGKGAAPRLAGQNAQYIEQQLQKFRRGDRRHAPEMTMVTRDLNDEQAHAAAVYLQSR